MFTPSSSAVSAFVVKFLYPFSHVVSSWCRLACLKSCPSQYSALLCYLIPAPALFADSLMTSFPPVTLAVLPHPPRLRPANWFISLSAVSAGLPSEECSCRGQTVCGCTCCRGELRCRPITQASSWAHSDDCAVDAVHHTHWWDRQLTKTLTKQLDMSWIINTKYWCWYMENPSSH